MKISQTQPTNKRKSPVKEKVLIAVFCVVIIASVLCVAWVYVMNTSFFKNKDTANNGTGLGDSIGTPVEIKEKCVNFLVTGIDYVEGSSRGKLTDVIMVVSFDIKGKMINVMQIPRDTYVGEDAPQTGKINEVYGRKNGGGIDGLANVVNKMLNITIDHYVTITMDGFKNIINKIGGVEVDVPNKIVLEGVTISPGLQVLDGITAEKFVRERHSYATQDLGRIEMQQVFMNALIKKVFNLSNSEVFKVAPTLIADITTDLTLNEILGFYKSLLNVNRETGINFHVLPIVGARGGAILSGKRLHTADVLNEYFRPYTPKVEAVDLGIIELVTDYPYEKNITQ